jgi:twinkle protein
VEAIEESQFLRHESCEACGSSDAKAVYSNGSTYCFSCQKSTRDGTEGSNKKSNISDPKVASLYNNANISALKSRKITEETCRKYGYRLAEVNGKYIQLAPYYKDGELVALKTRDANKNFSVVGDGKKLPFFGQHLFNDGKMLVITEGEIDAMSISQIKGNKWPVVSLPNGAQGAERAIKANYDWLLGFDEIVLMYDNDEPGREAAKRSAELLPLGKAKIATLPMKDANEMLVADRVEELIKAQWNAKPYRPDGIIAGEDIWEVVSKEDKVEAVPYPFSGLNEKLHGQRLGELVVLTAGSGIGKSAICREIAYSLIQQKQKVGMIFLEESVKRTALGLMGLAANKPLHISRDGVSKEQLKEVFDATLGSGLVSLYDHFGSTEVDNLLNKIRYMAKALDCKYIILDHLSIVISGLDGNEDERRTIDRAMTMLRTLVEETGISLILVSHLRRPSGDKGHEQGETTSLSQLRGSHAIAQLADAVIGAERNQQGENPNETTLRILKNRHSGETGIACTLIYERETGRLKEVEQVF